jgi:hypothetical protein
LASFLILQEIIDQVTFWRNKVNRRFHKNAKKIATYNLWAAEDRAQHMAEATNAGTVHPYDGPNVIDFDLPYYRGSATDPELEDHED